FLVGNTTAGPARRRASKPPRSLSCRGASDVTAPPSMSSLRQPWPRLRHFSRSWRRSGYGGPIQPRETATFCTAGRRHGRGAARGRWGGEWDGRGGAMGSGSTARRDAGPELGGCIGCRWLDRRERPRDVRERSDMMGRGALQAAVGSLLTYTGGFRTVADLGI